MFSEVIATTLMDYILPERRTNRDRDLLPKLLRAWSIEISHLTLPGGGQLWSEVRRLTDVRNQYAHQGERVEAADAELAIQCAREFIKQIVLPISEKVGHRRHEDGVWNRTWMRASPE